MAPLALIPLLAPLVPGLIRALAGDKAGDVAQKVSGVVTAIAGSDTPEAVEVALKDPHKSLELQIALARIELEAEEMRAEAARQATRDILADVSSARSQTVELARAGSKIAWGAPVTSVIVLVFFGSLAWTAMFTPIPEGSEALLNVILGAFGALATQVVNYWVGSSAGSARKDETLRAALPLRGR